MNVKVLEPHEVMSALFAPQPCDSTVWCQWASTDGERRNICRADELKVCTLVKFLNNPDKYGAVFEVVDDGAD